MKVAELIEQLQELPGYYELVAELDDEWPSIAEIGGARIATGYAVLSIQ